VTDLLVLDLDRPNAVQAAARRALTLLRGLAQGDARPKGPNEWEPV
jgi:hypothetical protein